MIKEKTKAKYDSDSIIHHHGLEAVRHSPAMYIGDTGAAGLFLVVRELLDNAADEALNGRNSFVGLWINRDGSFVVQDRGHGIPQGTKQIELVVNGKNVVNKMPTMQAIFGELHTSGKFKSDAYKVSIGSHGVGAKATNATAEYFRVATCYKGKTYSIGFEKGKLKEPVRPLNKKLTGPFGPLSNGTMVTFKPDAKIFKGGVKFPMAAFTEWASITSYLIPNFEIRIQTLDGKSKKFLSKVGLPDYIKSRMEKLNCALISERAPMFEYKTATTSVVIAFTTYDGCDVRGFTSCLNNADGGVHVDAVHKALYDGIDAFRNKRGPQFKAADLKDGLLGLINVNLHKAEFTSQSKTRLSDRRIDKEFIADLTKAAEAFFRKHKSLTKAVIEKATALSQLKTKFKASANALRELNKIKRQGMPLKYSSYDPKTPLTERELYLVEGDSAAGPGKMVKYPYQAILPLKGKIGNALNPKSGKKSKPLEESDEVLYIFGALNFDPKATNPIDKIQVSKIIFLPDPDPDGYHIGSLLCALLYKYVPELFERGMVYVALTHEFYSIYKGKLYLDQSVSALRAKLTKSGAPTNHPLHHIKGWGEIDKELFRIMALDPDSRRLVKLTADGTPELIEQIMGKDPSYRRKMLGIDLTAGEDE